MLAADLLQAIVYRAHSWGLLTTPIPNTNEADYPIVQYADDTTLIMKASQREVFNLKGPLQTFTLSTGLKVNYSKSCMIPINTNPEEVEI